MEKIFEYRGTLGGCLRKLADEIDAIPIPKAVPPCTDCFYSHSFCTVYPCVECNTEHHLFMAKLNKNCRNKKEIAMTDQIEKAIIGDYSPATIPTRTANALKVVMDKLPNVDKEHEEKVTVVSPSSHEKPDLADSLLAEFRATSAEIRKMSNILSMGGDLKYCMRKLTKELDAIEAQRKSKTQKQIEPDEGIDHGY
jgi:hypothetical protein